jgi:hypothetical protein
MKIENQVCSLEQAKRLKELGIIQESYLYHYFFNNVPRNLSGQWKLHHEYHKNFEHYSAFNVAELGVMLSTTAWEWASKIMTSDKIPYCHIELYNDAWGAYENEAKGRAELLIHLLKNNVLTPEEVNTRLIQS